MLLKPVLQAAGNVASTAKPMSAHRDTSAPGRQPLHRIYQALVHSRLLRAQLEIASHHRLRSCFPEPPGASVPDRQEVEAARARVQSQNQIGRSCLNRMYAQGDILVERVDHALAADKMVEAVDGGALAIAAGEAAGHHHKLHGCITLFRDDALARDIPDNLYLGHVQINGQLGRLEHPEHAVLPLPEGTYRIRRQRRLEPTGAAMIED